MTQAIAFVTIMYVPLISIFAATNEDHSEEQKAAVEAAEKWLARIDEGKHADGWDSAAAYLKNAVGKETFVKSLEGVRTPLGKLKSRKLKSQEYHTSLPGAPDGKYVVIQFETSFENKQTAIETVTPMLDGEVWKVSGYFIK